MLGKDPEEDSSGAESEGPPWMWGKKHLHCKSVEEEEGRFCVCQRMKATNLERQEEEFILCAPFGLHLVGDVDPLRVLSREMPGQACLFVVLIWQQPITHLRGTRHEISYQSEELCSNLGVSRIPSQSGHRKKHPESKLMNNWVW